MSIRKTIQLLKESTTLIEAFSAIPDVDLRYTAGEGQFNLFGYSTERYASKDDIKNLIKSKSKEINSLVKNITKQLTAVQYTKVKAHKIEVRGSDLPHFLVHISMVGGVWGLQNIKFKMEDLGIPQGAKSSFGR